VNFMPVSASLKNRIKMGNAVGVVADITLGSSYPTGGEPIEPKSLGLNAIYGLMAYPSGGYLFEFDHANKKLKAYTPVKAQAAHSHTENTAEEYTQNATTATAGAVSAAAASEVANATNLNSVICRVFAVGV
jgi:hypothetical protein